MSQEAYVNIDKAANGIATITFYHPAHNSLPGDILKKLADTITTAGNDDSVEVIILKSGGDRTFCAGASFTELITIADFETGKKFFMGFANVINACRKCPKIILGRVQGKAVGGGVGVASAVDYCFATKFSAIKLSELMVGIGPFVVGPAVERKVGTSAFAQLAIDASEFYPASWAKEKGLYYEVFDDVQQMDARIQVLAEKLVSTNPEARKLIKQATWTGTDNWDELLSERAGMSGQLVLSDYTKKELAKYKEKS